MSIQKKSLISTLKTAKKANVASDAKGEKVSSMRLANTRAMTLKSAKSLRGKAAVSNRMLSGKSVSSNKMV